MTDKLGHPGPRHAAIPAGRAQRELLLGVARRRVSAAGVTPPLTFRQLQGFAQAALAEAGMDDGFMDFATVLVSNEAWRVHVAAVPFERRLLLLPQCLRHPESCPADIDSFGLLCRHCGRCAIDGLLAEAEGLGYATLVAEGTIIVTSFIQTNKIDAVVGAGCLSSLERIFPYMEAAACAGIAIPLLRDGCANTAIDVDWLREAIHLQSAGGPDRLDLEAIRSAVGQWCSPDGIAELLGPPAGATERIAHGWLAGEGKRWRPFLAVCAYQALAGGGVEQAGEDLRRVALAVECFHKASLIHDDIEDEDSLRYCRDTLHVRFGVPVALNVGDLLIGDGYRLLSESAVPAEMKARMLQAASRAHRDLCLGQGAELCWARQPRGISPDEVIEIFRLKTAPAFEVSLRLGAILAGADQDVYEALAEYSRALGIAYQIRDDLADMASRIKPAALRAEATGRLRPSLPLALACERTGLPVLNGSGGRNWRQSLESRLAEPAVLVACEQYLQHYRQLAVDSLKLLRSASLKGLLRRALAKIFSEIPTEDRPIEPDARHVDRSRPGGRIAR